MTALERWARATGHHNDQDGVDVDADGWLIRERDDRFTIDLIERSDLGVSGTTWHVDAVAVHLWALALEVGEVVDLGECSECAGHGLVNTWDPHAKRCQPCRGSGRDVRPLALLVCQAVGGPLASRSAAVVTRAARARTEARSALRAWAKSKAETREVVASARLDTRALDPMGKPWTAGPLGFVEPERMAGEPLPETMRRDALVADLARWLLAWLDGVECRACRGDGDWTSACPACLGSGEAWPAGSCDSCGGGGDASVDCTDCWGTGSLGLRTSMEAALSERTPAADEAAE